MNFLIKRLSGPLLDPEFRNRSRIEKKLALYAIVPFLRLNKPRFRKLGVLKVNFKRIQQLFERTIYSRSSKFANLYIFSAFGIPVKENAILITTNMNSNPGFNLNKIKSRINVKLDLPSRVLTPVTTGFTVVPYNFYHFMTDYVITYLAETPKGGRRELFLPYLPSERQCELLTFLGIPFLHAQFQANHTFDDIKILSPVFVRRNKLWQRSTHPADNYMFNISVINSARKVLLDKVSRYQSQANYRIFVSRRGASRAPSNLQQVESLLESRGFIIFNSEEYSLEESLYLFSNAHLIVGIHGAGLTNMMFAKLDCHIIELIPTEHKFGGQVRPIFELMASACDFTYGKYFMPTTLESWHALVHNLEKLGY